MRVFHVSVEISKAGFFFCSGFDRYGHGGFTDERVEVIGWVATDK